MNDQQLEAVLRSSLARHADTVDSGPTWSAEPMADDHLAEHRPRHRGPNTWWAVAATVAAVLAVIGVVLAVRHSSSDHTRPATPVTITRTACETALPKVWSDAVYTSAVANSVGVELLGVGPRGELVTAPAVDVNGTGRVEISLTRPDGSVQPIMPVQLDDLHRGYAFDTYTYQSVVLDENWIVVPVSAAKLELIDRRNVHNTREIPAGGTVPDKIALFDNHVYWINASKGHATGTVQDYDIAAGRARPVTHHANLLTTSQYGLGWTDAQDVLHVIAGQNPTVIPGQPGTYPELAANGRYYAWATNSGIGWYDDVTRRTVYVQDSAATGTGSSVAAVVGPYVVEFVNQAGDARVIDTRTAALVKITGVRQAISGGGVVAFDSLSRVRLDTLPGLHC
jgi:hypothetical protein